MKKLFLTIAILMVSACSSQTNSNPCPEPERKGLYEMRDHYACQERELKKLRR